MGVIEDVAVDDIVAEDIENLREVTGIRDQQT